MWFGLPHEFPKKLHTVKKKRRKGSGEKRRRGRLQGFGGRGVDLGFRGVGGHVLVGTILKASQPADRPDTLVLIQ